MGKPEKEKQGGRVKDEMRDVQRKRKRNERLGE